jgi:hypothetical protein
MQAMLCEEAKWLVAKVRLFSKPSNKMQKQKFFDVNSFWRAAKIFMVKSMPPTKKRLRATALLQCFQISTEYFLFVLKLLQTTTTDEPFLKKGFQVSIS